jgi:geranylgeranyl pyrophosphate synthase
VTAELSDPIERDLTHWIADRRSKLEALLAARLPPPPAGGDPGRLSEAMRYSLLSPGKRLRPLLALAAAEAVGARLEGQKQEQEREQERERADDGAVQLACASVELVHCYSLIHDDLPAMDDDDFRRGQPSNHKVFGEATAILAGDALLTLAFEWIAEAGARAGRPGDFLRASAALARGGGMEGMVRGQARDLGEPAPATLPGLERLHAEKTAALFRAALEIGACAGGADEVALGALARFGECYGVAFQHADDLDDADHPGHAAAARRRLGELVEEGIRRLRETLGDRGSRLEAFARALDRRSHGAAA